MKYQELIDLCKGAYNSGNLSSACEYWEMIYGVLDKKLSKIDRYNKAERQECYNEFNEYMKQFSDKEVYDITDYDKEQYNLKMGYLGI